YLRPSLTVEADLTRLVRTLIQDLKRQVLANVVLTAQTDFASTTGEELHLAEVAQLPALVLVGPGLAEDRFYSLNELPGARSNGGTFERRRTPYTVDLDFTIVGASDHTAELLNLMAAVQAYFHANPLLAVARDPRQPDAGVVRYEMDIPPGGDMKVTG